MIVTYLNFESQLIMMNLKKKVIDEGMNDNCEHSFTSFLPTNHCIIKLLNSFDKIMKNKI